MLMIKLTFKPWQGHLGRVRLLLTSEADGDVPGGPVEGQVVHVRHEVILHAYCLLEYAEVS